LLNDIKITAKKMESAPAPIFFLQNSKVLAISAQ